MFKLPEVSSTTPAVLPAPTPNRHQGFLMKHTLLSRRLMACLLASTSAMIGQTTPSERSTPPTSDETITLDEFSVTESRADGYRSTTSLTATGIGAKIMDTPVTINVLTEEFLRDTAASLRSAATA